MLCVMCGRVLNPLVLEAPRNTNVTARLLDTQGTEDRRIFFGYLYIKLKRNPFVACFALRGFALVKK